MSSSPKNLDTHGFSFTIKFFIVFSLLIFAAKFVPNFAQSNPTPALIYEAGIERKLSLLQDKNKLQRAALLESTQKSKEKNIVLGFVGDIMLDRNVERMILTKGDGDFNFPFVYIGNKLRGYDFMFGNLEGAVSNKGKDQGSLYSFRMDTKVLSALKNAGFDILSVANNHSADWGSEAMYDTLRRLDGMGFRYVGGGFNILNAYRPKIIDINNTKIAYLAFSQFESGKLDGNVTLAHLSEENLKKGLKDIRQEVDIIIVSIHFGDEYEALPNEYQKYISRLAIDSGADLVVGHHPHVVQPVEKYGDGYIAYSLGNFIFDQNFSEETMRGLLLEATIKSGKIIEVKKIPTRINKYFQPEIE